MDQCRDNYQFSCPGEVMIVQREVTYFRICAGFESRVLEGNGLHYMPELDVVTQF